MSDCPTCVSGDCGLLSDLDLYSLEDPPYNFVANCPPGYNCQFPKACCIGVELKSAVTATLTAEGPYEVPFSSADFWEIISGSLPPGLTFHGGHVGGGLALIDGTPTTAGFYNFTVRFTLGENGDQAEKTYRIAVMSLGPDEDLPELVIGEAYEQQLTVEPTPDTQTWTVTDGTLPDGIELTTAGVLQGTPTETGDFPFTASVTSKLNGTTVTCEEEFTFSASTIEDMPLDSAVYAVTDDVIIGVRGGRAFKFNATTGALISSEDFSQPGFSPSCLTYDAGLNRIFAAVWNQPKWDVGAQLAARSIQVIVPDTLAVESEIDYLTLVASNPPFGPYYLSGVAQMRSQGGFIYCYGLSVAQTDWLIRFEAANPANLIAQEAVPQFSWPTLAIGLVGGADVAFANRTWSSPAEIECWDFLNNTGGYSDSAGMPADPYYISLEFSEPEQKLFVARQNRYIDVFTVVGPSITTPNITFSATVDTGRADFTGVQARLSPYDGLIYFAGLGDNTVIVLDPSDNSFVVKEDFDLPVDICFSPSAPWAVQQGSVGLKKIT